MGTRGMGWGLRRALVAGVAGIALIGTGTWTADPAQAAPIPIGGNPTPLTDLFASTVLPPLTGGTQRICATSQLGIAVHCVEHLNVQPSIPPTASGTTFGHWVYCKVACTGSLLVHEMVHVAQFEATGDTFGPLYLVEAAQHGTGCDNIYERPAYQTGGTCL